MESTKMQIEPQNRDFRRFDHLQQKILGNYVYALRDPRDHKVFYIGQATQVNRVFDHFIEAENALNEPAIQASPKVRMILDIWSAGKDVDWFILACGLDKDTNELNAVESAAINLLTQSQNGPSLNCNAGLYSTFMDQEMVIAQGAPPIDPTRPLGTVFIFPIQRQLANGLDPYGATRSAWSVAQKYRKVDGAMAVGLVDFISKGVFDIDHWQPHGARYEFVGKEADMPDLLHKNWSKIISLSMGYWQRGNYLIVSFDGFGRFKFLRGNSDQQSWHRL
ncbi:LEM-3-like GIY-YIG domain-containing protein [Pontibacter sp. G13]|uniref:LEM-3-like GIY-YIG domain-containing protein n=1 Tax=Pontibacter sp. G13 TaxID=3074898 RepID=UPI002889792A|nr:hypothetical protein [Pontibacter sp. G13]WNJ19088.1 hypothetical protein RJD25_01240 [Pontibacter sp. G13]